MDEKGLLLRSVVGETMLSSRSCIIDGLHAGLPRLLFLRAPTLVLVLMRMFDLAFDFEMALLLVNRVSVGEAGGEAARLFAQGADWMDCMENEPNVGMSIMALGFL